MCRGFLLHNFEKIGMVADFLGGFYDKSMGKTTHMLDTFETPTTVNPQNMILETN